MGTTPFGLRFLPEVHFDTEWKSPWRIDFERRMAEEELKPKAFVKPVQVAAVKMTVARRRGPTPRLREPRLCAKGCGRTIFKTNQRGICRWCPYKDKPEKTPKVCSHAGCGRRLNHQNQSGVCDRHWKVYIHRKTYGEPPQCKHPGCLEVLVRDNKDGLCGWHHPARRGRLRYRTTKPRMEEVVCKVVEP